jgi:capsular polysaccharide biosynthesis protein
MHRSPKVKWLVAGVVLILLLPVFAVTASLLSYFLPKQYSSAVTLEVTASRQAGLLLAFEREAPSFDGAARLHKVKGTDFYEIAVTNPDPQLAAEQANALADSLQAAVSSGESESGVRLRQRAEPQLLPSRPNVQMIMAVGYGGGTLAAVLGGLCVARAYRGRTGE